MIWGLAAFLVLVVSVVLWAAGGIQSPGTFSEAPTRLMPGITSSPPAPGEWTLMTWNIAYAYGSGSEGVDYQPKTHEEMDSRLRKMGELIRNESVDVALIQEIDFDSGRSHHVDQLEALSRYSGLPYVARAVSWRAGYVPFPYWPPAHHFGKTVSGGAVLSRFPIASNRVTLYPKPAANAWWYNLFYLFRYSQEVTIERDGKRLRVFNQHLEAFEKQNRLDQARMLAETIGALNAGDPILALAGDFNTVPPEAKIHVGFQSGDDDDYRDDPTLDVLRRIPGFREIVSVEEYAKDESLWLTYPADSPNRRLDYIFVRDGADVLERRVIRTGELSDHLPVVTKIRSN